MSGINSLQGLKNGVQPDCDLFVTLLPDFVARRWESGRSHGLLPGHNGRIAGVPWAR